MLHETNETLSQNENSNAVRKDMTRREFSARVLIVAGIIVSIFILLLLFRESSQVILLVFAGLLISIFIRGIAYRLSSYTSLSINWSLFIVLAFLIGSIVLGIWLMMPSLQHQINEISLQLPETVNQLQDKAAQYSAGRWILRQLPQNAQETGIPSANVFGRITGIFSSFIGFLVNIAIVLMAGVYFSFNPQIYYEGVLKLFPKNSHRRIKEILDTIHFNLQRWMIGRITVMTINGVLTAIGLWLLGVPLAVPLGINTALFNFIPNIGPFLAAVPAVLIGFTQNNETALYVAILFFLIQNLEGFVLTPLIQQKAVSLPPVLIIAAQLLMGVLFGFSGVLLAVPITAVIFILVKMVYVEDILGNNVEVKGEDKIKEVIQNREASAQ
ncbi:MAG: AI-2E family transporter [Pyrinomonadaceae bacterium]